MTRPSPTGFSLRRVLAERVQKWWILCKKSLPSKRLLRLRSPLQLLQGGYKRRYRLIVCALTCLCYALVVLHPQDHARLLHYFNKLSLASALLSDNGRLREMFLLEKLLERLTCQIDHEPCGKSLHLIMVPPGYLLMKVSTALTLVAYSRELVLPPPTSILMGTSNTNLLPILSNLR